MWGLNQKMVMGCHKTKGGHLDMEKLGCLLKQVEELLVICVILKKAHAFPGTVHHMMPRIRIVYSQGPGHRGTVPEFITKGNRRFDPSTTVQEEIR